jgi:hypothetical protein
MNFECYTSEQTTKITASLQRKTKIRAIEKEKVSANDHE